MAVALFGWGSLLLADWLHDRETLGAGSAAGVGARGASPAYRTVPRDPRMKPWLDKSVAWSPTRKTKFGKDTALLATGSSVEGPGEVFVRLLESLAEATDARSARESLRREPTAAAALRLNATVSNGPICASLVRLPLDAAAAAGGRLRTEPGAVVLAFRAQARWDYVTFFFPAGLDLDALVRDSAPPPRSIEVLGSEAKCRLK